MTGTIKKIIRDKGVGFIVPDDGSAEVFFHRSNLATRMQFKDFNESELGSISKPRHKIISSGGYRLFYKMR